jgi:hypothetical protein
MNSITFEKLVNERFEACIALLENKAAQYATEEDRLHNFKIAGLFQEETPLKALLGMMSKHLVSLKDYVKKHENRIETSKKNWIEVLNDTHNYLYLAEGLLEDFWKEQK